MRTTALITMSLLLACPLAGAQSFLTTAPPPVETALVVDDGPVGPGGRLWISFQQILPEGWHTYWRNPGDTGQAPVFHWRLPPGFGVGEAVWPTPDRFITSDIVSYGYEGRLVLPFPANIAGGVEQGSYTVGLDVEWLVCREECIPLTRSLQTTVRVGAVGSAQPSPATDAAGANRVPTSFPATVDFRVHDGRLYLRFPRIAGMDRPPEDPWLFAAEWGFIDQSAPQDLTVEKEYVTVSVPVGDRLENQMRGVLLWQKSQRIAYEFVAARAP